MHKYKYFCLIRCKYLKFVTKKITTSPTITYKKCCVFGRRIAARRHKTMGIKKKTISAFARVMGKRHCDERNSGAQVAAVKKRNCLRRVRRPKDSEADYKAEFFVLGQSQAQQRNRHNLSRGWQAKGTAMSGKAER